MAYATFEDVSKGFRELTEDEQNKATALLDEAAIIIDSYNSEAAEDVKKLVSCRMVRRILETNDFSGMPMGISQGTMSALGYSQSFTLPSGGASGELYINKAEKRLLGVGNKIGTHSPVEDLT